MKNISKILPCYAADTSGVCSALYELGGMTVVHDASGCNSTYATHDEPRWEDMPSMIYISALTEIDAIMGDDEKLISDVTAAAKDQNPRFIAVCGSPMPMMTGVDFDAVAAEIEQRTGIRTFGLHTNGTHSYIRGASEALLAITKEYVRPAAQTIQNGVSIFGATALDFPSGAQIDSLKALVERAGFPVVSCFAMQDTLDGLKKAASAQVSLVISQTGLAAAEYLYQAFGIPYVCGVPVSGLEQTVTDALRAAIQTGKPAFPCAIRSQTGKPAAVIGEGIMAGSLAAAEGLRGNAARVICPLDGDAVLNPDTDSSAASEEEIEAVLREWKPETVFADILYKYVLPEGTKHIQVPHFAFSGRRGRQCRQPFPYGDSEQASSCMTNSTARLVPSSSLTSPSTNS